MFDEEEIQEIIDTFLSHLDINNYNNNNKNESQEDEHVLLNMFIRHPNFQKYLKITGNNLYLFSPFPHNTQNIDFSP